MHLPPFDQYPILTDNIIILRPPRISDIPDIMEICFYDGKPAETQEEAKEMLQKINLDYENGNCVHWIISDFILHQTIGTCGFYRGFQNETGEIGYVLLPEFRGYGWMTHAVQLAIRFGFNDMGLKRIIAYTDQENVKSQKVLERIGFTLSGKKKDGNLEYELFKHP
ncbi:MAG: GNAT family N-acetyltransferase [Saprospiraceae bacterium]|nr:GNAT family N-acetyltransferase [Saprospiraceae bacterium]